MQMPDNHQHQEDEALQAPPELVPALGRLSQKPVFIPPTVDEAILRAAQRHLGKPGRPGLKWWHFMRWVAAGAAVVLLALIPLFFRKPAPNPPAGAAFAREDLNHDGRVDILDAFALARQLKSGGTPGLQLDMNGDGVVDERDTAILAARAVNLEKGGHS